VEASEKTVRLLEREVANLRSEFEEFMSALSHDLSATFRQTEGFSQIVLKNNQDSFDDKTKRHFGFIQNGVEKGSSILDALREYSHLRRKNAAFLEFDSGDAVTEVLTGLKDWIEQSDAQIDIQGLPSITGDKEQIKLVFFHLLKNALFYRSSLHKPNIVISCGEHPDDWAFSVSDNGIGVPKGMDERIFQVLKRAVVDADYPGRGMGLATAKKIILRHGGTIKLVRDASDLTIFSFTIAKTPIDI
jgi:light-regulated signal transduction histidine kinase (bacteriophytochrome)